MSARTIARKDVEDAIRSRVLWIVTIAFVALMGGAAYVPSVVVADALSPTHALRFLGGPTGTILPITALVAGVLSIAGERESGRLKVLLGLPHTRRDVLVGKTAGRMTVLAVAIAIGFATAGIVMIGVYGGLPSLPVFAAYVAITVLLGLAFCAIAVGISAAAATRARAMASAVGVFFVFEFVWGLLPFGIYYAVHGRAPATVATRPTWYLLLSWLNPIEAYTVLGNRLLPPATVGIVVSDRGTAQTQASTGPADVLSGPVPYLDEAVCLLVLGAWIALPLTLGYLRFRSVDLA